MPPHNDISFELLAGKLAGVAGAVVSMKFLQGTFMERAFMAMSGAIVSYYATPWLSPKIGLPEGFTGFLVGMFGMAVASRGWEWVQTTPVAALWQIVLDWLARRSGGTK